jgi:hypothetical protein
MSVTGKKKGLTHGSSVISFLVFMICVYKCKIHGTVSFLLLRGKNSYGTAHMLLVLYMYNITFRTGISLWWLDRCVYVDHIVLKSYKEGMILLNLGKLVNMQWWKTLSGIS